MKLSSLVLLIAVACAGSAAHADTRRRVAVVVVSQVNVADDESSAVAKALEIVLAERHEDVVPWTLSRSRLPAEGLQAQCLSDASCIHRLGETLGADEFLFLAVVRVGKSIQVDVSWATATSAQTTFRARVGLRRFDNSAQQVFRSQADQIFPRHETAPPAESGASSTNRRSETDAALSTGTGTDTAQGAKARRLTQGVWIAGAVGAATLVGAVSLGLHTRGQYKDCDADGAFCSNAELDDIDRNAFLADTLLVGSVAAGVTAAILYYRSDSRTESTVAVQPLESGISVGYSARF